MGAITELMTAIKDVLLLIDKVERVGKTLTELTERVQEIDKRLVRLETLVEIAKEKNVGRRLKN